MELIDLPNRVTELLQGLDTPESLRKHLQIVYSTASELLTQCKREWPTINLNEKLILIGAGTHDIGKAKIKSELFESGTKHELAGRQMLLKFGFTEDESRFAFTHGNWREDNLKLEDLLVSLADKIWKGKRIEELEEKVSHLLSESLQIDYWEIYGSLDKILEQISSGADERLSWQNQ